MMDPNELSRRGLEQLSNVTSRHHFLEKTAKGVAATMAALALGGIGTKSALAGWGQCGCCNSAATPCGNYGLSCPNSAQSCPSGWGLCTYNTHCTCNGYCCWTSGYWSCPCNGRTSYCTDCYNGPGTSCRACTCNAYY